MKTAIKTLFVIAMVTIVASCAKNPAKLLVKKDGTWTITTVTTLVGFGTFTDISTATFSDGAGTMTDSNGDVTNFTWTYDKKTEQITVTTVDGSNTSIVVSDVTDIETDSEKWTFVSGTVNGVAITTADYTQVSTLIRK